MDLDCGAARLREPELAPIASDSDFERFISAFTSYEALPDFRYHPATLSLERMRGLCRLLGEPQAARPALHIAGTKGKGSTSLILESLLAAEGLSVGSYLSPHVEHLRERIRWRAEPISEADLCVALNAAIPHLRALQRRGEEHFPTFFELMTALAMAHFRDRQADWAIYEVGLGGRLDATNVVTPFACAITSIGLEHTQKLGTTLAAIAGEKAGIIKPGVPVIIGPMEREARDAIGAVAAAQRAPLRDSQPRRIRLVGRDRLAIGGFPGDLPAGAVRGPGLRDDLAIALELWELVLAAAGRAPRASALAAALAGLALPGRIELLPGEPPVLLDGAHTAESARSLRLAIEEIGLPRPRALVSSLAVDKRCEAVLAELAGLADQVFFTRHDAVRSLEPADLARRFIAAGHGRGAIRVAAIEDPQAACDEALALGIPLVATGSLYLAGTLRVHLRERGWTV